ncbi:MAG: hypothetical protein AAF561_05360 [Planctomycetota bacterium]
MTQNMPRTTMMIGGLLTALGIVGFLLGGANAAARTALIPAYAGVPLVLLGLIATRGDKARMIAMHIAVLLAFLGALATIFPIIRRVIPGEATMLAMVSLFGMLGLCGGYVVIAVQSFIAARKARKAAGGFEVVR